VGCTQAHLVAQLGDSLLAFGSDHPHWDAADPEDLTAFSKTHNPDLAHRILYQNAHDFFFKT
jgi:predicted TIM-barrel fold metal-dependent hydrolase